MASSRMIGRGIPSIHNRIPRPIVHSLVTFDEIEYGEGSAVRAARPITPGSKHLSAPPDSAGPGGERRRCGGAAGMRPPTVRRADPIGRKNHAARTRSRARKTPLDPCRPRGWPTRGQTFDGGPRLAGVVPARSVARRRRRRFDAPLTCLGRKLRLCDRGRPHAAAAHAAHARQGRLESIHRAARRPRRPRVRRGY